MSLAGTTTLTTAQTWTNGSANALSVSGPINSGAFLLTTAGAGNIGLSGNITGTAGITASGTGTVTLSANNTNTDSGTTTITGGILVASNTGALGSGNVVLGGGSPPTAGTLRIAPTAPSLASLSGFGTNGAGWTVNQSGSFTSTAIASDVLTLTDNNALNQARTAFYNTQVPVSTAFTASFTYTAGGSKLADGIAFVLQDKGVTALGGSGGSLGYGGITPSVATEINIYTGATGGIGINATLATNGAIPTNESVSPVVLNSGDPINVSLNYNPTTQMLTETLTDATNSADTFTQVYPGANLASILGSGTAYVGFTGSDGGSVSTQQISNFSFNVAGATAEYANNLTLTNGATATVDVAATSANPTITMGMLSVGAGPSTLTQLNVTGSTVASGQTYGLTLGATTLAGNVAFNVANNTAGGGNALGTLTLGPVSDGGGGYGITMSGAGTLVLTGASAYSGATNVLGGTLRVSGSLAAGSAVSVGGSGASGTPTLGGSGTINGPVTINGPGSGAAGILAPGISGTPSQLTLANSLTLSSGSILDFILTPNITTGNDQVLMTGNNLLTIGSSGTVNITATGMLTNGNYVLISNPGGTISGGSGWTVGSVTGDSGHAYSVGAVGTNFDLTVTWLPLTWTGSPGGNGSGAGTPDVWDIATSANWATSTAAAGIYNDATPVTFNNSNATGGPAPDGNVYITDSGVNPTSVTFANTSAVTYSINPANPPAAVSSAAPAAARSAAPARMSSSTAAAP